MGVPSKIESPMAPTPNISPKITQRVESSSNTEYKKAIHAITQIIISIYGIFTADKLINSMLEATNTYPEAIQTRINTLFQNSGVLYITLIAGINIILNVLIIYLALSNKLLKKKGSVIACSVGSLFTATYTITELFAVINIIVIIILLIIQFYLME